MTFLHMAHTLQIIQNGDQGAKICALLQMVV